MGKGKRRQPLRRKAPVAPHSPAVANHQGKSAGSATGGKPGLHSQPEPKGGAGTKKEQVLALLRRKQGATLTELMQATRWQAHSVRGFLSGTVSKKMKLKVKSGKRVDGMRVYPVRG